MLRWEHCFVEFLINFHYGGGDFFAMTGDVDRPKNTATYPAVAGSSGLMTVSAIVKLDVRWS